MNRFLTRIVAHAHLRAAPALLPTRGYDIVPASKVGVERA